MTSSGERSTQTRQRSEDALCLEAAVLFRRLHCLAISDFGRCVLICAEVRVSQGSQRLFECERIGSGIGPGRTDSSERRLDVRLNVLNGSRIDAHREANCYRCDCDPEQGWMKTVHGACTCLLIFNSRRTCLQAAQ